MSLKYAKDNGAIQLFPKPVSSGRLFAKDVADMQLAFQQKFLGGIMSRLYNRGMVFCATLSMTLWWACSNNAVSPSSSEVGRVTLSIKGLSGSALAKGSVSPATADKVTVTSATFVIEKVELENKSDRSMDFKFDQPFLQDLMSITTLAEIQTFDVPFGTYDKVKVDIDDLDVQDGDVFVQNPDLQNLSIRIEGFLNDAPSETFVFTSDISINVRLNLSPPLVINEETVNSNIVLDFDYGSWFRGDGGRFLGSDMPGNQQAIERNIRESFRIFRDDNKDGKKDEHFELKGPIDSIGDDYIIVAETSVFVTEGTRIIGDDEENLSLSDLVAGMMVRVNSVVRDSGELVATKVKVLDGESDDKDDDDDQDDDEDDDHSDDRHEDFELEGEIESLGENSLVVSEKQVFVTEDTRILDGHEDELLFSELEVGMRVEVHVITRENGELIATKVRVENGGDDSDNDEKDEVFEVNPHFSPQQKKVAFSLI
jgi:hypothetical protein